MDRQIRTKIFLTVFVIATISLAGFSSLYFVIFPQDTDDTRSPQETLLLETLNNHNVYTLEFSLIPDSCNSFCQSQEKQVCIGAQIVDAVNKDDEVWVECSTSLNNRGVLKAQCACV